MLRSLHYWWPEAPEDHQKASEPHRHGAPGPVGPTSFKTDPLFVVFGARSWLLSQNAADSHKDFHIFPFSSKTSPVECLTPETKRCSIYYQSYPVLKQVNGRKCTVLSESCLYSMILLDQGLQTESRVLTCPMECCYFVPETRRASHISSPQFASFKSRCWTASVRIPFWRPLLPSWLRQRKGKPPASSLRQFHAQI